MKRAALLWLFLVFSTTMLFASVAMLEKAEIKKNELRLHFNKGYNKSKIHHFTLTHPYREVFDIPQARMKHRNVGKNLHSSHCRSIRVSQYKPNTVRVVLETGKGYSCMPYRPILSYKSFHIPLPPFKVKTKQYRRHQQIKPKVIIHKKSYTKKKTTKKYYPKAKLIDTSRGYHRGSGELIVIDAGHGGHDTGAIGGGKREKDLVLQIAKRLERQLKKRGYRVYMTRRTDRFLKLPQRTKIADRKDAKVFISIHANSLPKGSRRNKVYGIETFFLQTTRDAKSQRIAARENKAVLKGAGSRLSKKVIVDAVLNGPKIIESNKLAIDVQRHMLGSLRKHYRGVRDMGVRSAPFWVLVGASRPSILIETGYISNPYERKRLFDPKYQERMAEGIARGVQSYLNNRKKEIEF